jgi:hypothetical protein
MEKLVEALGITRLRAQSDRDNFEECPPLKG